MHTSQWLTLGDFPLMEILRKQLMQWLLSLKYSPVTAHASSVVVLTFSESSHGTTKFHNMHKAHKKGAIQQRNEEKGKCN
jgi:hypothetical protein